MIVSFLIEVKTISHHIEFSCERVTSDVFWCSITSSSMSIWSYSSWRVEVKITNYKSLKCPYYNNSPYCADIVCLWSCLRFELISVFIKMVNWLLSQHFLFIFHSRVGHSNALLHKWDISSSPAGCSREQVYSIKVIREEEKDIRSTALAAVIQCLCCILGRFSSGSCGKDGFWFFNLVT